MLLALEQAEFLALLGEATVLGVVRVVDEGVPCCVNHDGAAGLKLLLLPGSVVERKGCAERVLPIGVVVGSWGFVIAGASRFMSSLLLPMAAAVASCSRSVLKRFGSYRSSLLIHPVIGGPGPTWPPGDVLVWLRSTKLGHGGQNWAYP